MVEHKFCCKTAECCEKPCEEPRSRAPSVSNTVQLYENVFKDSFVNYKSAAPTAGLPARRAFLGIALCANDVLAAKDSLSVRHDLVKTTDKNSVGSWNSILRGFCSAQ